MNTSNACKICGSNSHLLFKAQVLKKHQVSYFQCSNCQFIQTEEPYWLPEAYASAITSLDIGLIDRNLHYLRITQNIINQFFDADAVFLDYGGGYGMFVRMMRDAGYTYYRQDDYCENIFAKHFDVTDLKEQPEFELVTAFEVFEHLQDPEKELKRMLGFGKSILFSTGLQPANQTFKSAEDWWYFAPETGQHIAFFTPKALSLLAGKHQLHYYNHDNLHLFTPLQLASKALKPARKSFFDRWTMKKNKRESLLQTDFNYIKNL